MNNRTEQRRLYREQNREVLREKNKQYYEKNKEKTLERCKEYKRINNDTIKVKAKIYRESRPEYMADYYKNNKNKCLKSNREYIEKNRERIRSLRAFRRATKKQATPPWAEKAKILTLYKKVKWLEDLTGLKYHVDHVIPLESEIVCGLHVWHNLQILEAPLNIKKKNKVNT